ncbi:MAG: L-threonylcarbamoyladenylate synthase [Alphaproteobacteria bacterium]|nr:L-threonylcarbamoyladenylate synthase [Alphaproteobacteria bacterium]
MIWSGENPTHIEEAARWLAQGHLLGFPTETVYGLGADAGQDDAVLAIYAAKGRPVDHPLIVHISEAADAALFADPIPDFALALMAAHWPGPLTLILPRRAGVADTSAAHQASIGLRCPSHPVAQALLRTARSFGVAGVSGPSANRFGRVSPTQAEHVVSEFDGAIRVLDGGPCQVGIESVIVDCSRGQPVLLRPGMLNAQVLSHSAGQRVLSPEAASATLCQTTPKASGLLASHYAPNARVRLLDPMAMAHAAQTLNALEKAGLAIWSPLAPDFGAGHWRAMPTDADACARTLFQVLRDFEHLGVEEIWICPPPAHPDWDGVRDRLTRASH